MSAPSASPPPGNGFRRSRLKAVIQNGTLCVAALCFGLLVAEGIARMVLTDFYQCDDRLGWVFRANRSGFRIARSLEYWQFARINPHGFRDEVRVYNKPNGTFRVLVLGDSFVSALQVPLDKTMPKMLEARLKARRRVADPKYEVINAGVDGYGTTQEMLLYRDRGHKYRADMVLLAVFLYNDLQDNYYAAGSANHALAVRCGRPYFTLSDGRLIRMDGQYQGRAQRRTGIGDGILRNSYLYSAVLVPFLRTVDLPFKEQDVYAATYPAALMEAWELTQRMILALREAVNDDGSRLILVVVPGPYDANNDWARADLGRVVEVNRGHTLLKAFLDEQRLPYIDLLPHFRAYVADGHPRTYFRKDHHWTVDGHALAGSVIADWMLQHCETVRLRAGACEG